MREKSRKDKVLLFVSLLSRRAFYGGLFLLIMLSGFSCNSKKEDEHTEHEHSGQAVYTCPMHPQIVRNEPGACPICGMDLVLKAEGQQSRGKTIDLSTVLQATSASVVASIDVVEPVVKQVPVVFEAPGVISYDTRQFNNVAARYSGRIEKLYVKYNFQPVEKGQKLMEIYSPELVTAQQQLIYLVANDPDATTLINGAKQKLKLLGLTEAQIAEVIRTREAKYSLTVYSPYSGHLHELINQPMSNAATNMASVNGGGMNSSAISMGRDLINSQLSLKEGMYVERGQAVFNVYNIHQVWAILNVYAQDVEKVKVGLPVALQIENQPDSIIDAKINFIEPFIEQGDKLLSVRVYLPNTHHKLKVGALVEGSINAGTKKGLWLPRTAVLDLGVNKIVWLKKEDNRFEAYQVTTGIETNDLIEIIGGLQQEDEVAVDAQYLVDSQTFITVNRNESREK